MPSLLRRTFSPTAGLAAFAAACVLTSGCGRPEPELAIRAQIAALEEAAESGDLDGFRDILHPEFHGRDAVTRPEVLLQVRALRHRHSDVRITVRIRSVELVADTEARVQLAAALGDGAMLAPGSRAEVWRFSTDWERDGSDWQIVRATWEPGDLADLGLR